MKIIIETETYSTYIRLVRALIIAHGVWKGLDMIDDADFAYDAIEQLNQQKVKTWSVLGIKHESVGPIGEVQRPKLPTITVSE